MTTSRKAARADDESSEDDGVDEESSDVSCVVECLVGGVGEKGGDDDIVDNSLPGSNNHLPIESIICYYDCPILTNDGL